MISFTFINYMGFWRSSRTWNFEELDRSLWCRAFPTIGNWRIGIVPRSWPFMDVHGRCRMIRMGRSFQSFYRRNSHQNIVSVYSTWCHTMPCHTLFLVSWESEWSLLGLTSRETSNARADIPWSCKCSGDFFQTDPEFKNAVTALQIGTAQMKFWDTGQQSQYLRP